MQNAKLAFFVICLALTAPAQETRSMIYGRVLDPSGAPVAGATVSVTHGETNTTLNLKSNDTGYYEANFLLPGKYEIQAEMAGFKKVVQKGSNFRSARGRRSRSNSRSAR